MTVNEQRVMLRPGGILGVIYRKGEHVIKAIIHCYVILVCVQHFSEPKFLRQFTETKRH